MHQRLSHTQARFIRGLRFKKHRQRAQAFVVEGEKSVHLLLRSRYEVSLLVGTCACLQTIDARTLDAVETVIQADKNTLASLSSLENNGTLLAVAHMPSQAHATPPKNTWGLVLDGIRDPGNLGTIVRLADWFHIPALICSTDTVDVYNPKVIQASMGSFVHVLVYHTELPTWLCQTPWPIFGTFPEGKNMHHTQITSPSLIVIGNEAHGIRPAVLPYIQTRMSIPRYGHAASLNAAMATAIVCDYWKNQRTVRGKI